MNPRPLLHLEGAAVFVLGLAAYHLQQGSWLMFALLFLVPDLSMIGYAFNVRVGAALYNTVHTYLGPFLLGGFAWRAHHAAALSVAIIWLTHIGLDRALGYGLKYPTQFKDTHLSPARHLFEVG